MNGVDDVITNIYDTLLQLRYPHITKAESKDMGVTILNGENRVCLLSWLLTEKSSLILAQLEKLKDDALEDKLFEFYSQIGISNNKDLLLGKCSLKKQLPTLRLLLDFMRKVHIEPYTSTDETKEILVDIIKLHTNGAQQTSLPVKSKLSYTEAIQYFEKNEKEILTNNRIDIKINLSENLYTKIDDKLDKDQRTLFNKEKEKFIETFQTISSWQTQPRNLDKATTDSIYSNIKSIYSDFLALQKVLRAKDEISNMHLTRELPKTTTPLNAIIGDIVLCNEELKNLSINDSIN